MIEDHERPAARDVIGIVGLPLRFQPLDISFKLADTRSTRSRTSLPSAQRGRAFAHLFAPVIIGESDWLGSPAKLESARGLVTGSG
jgi:hypothetical protein